MLSDTYTIDGYQYLYLYHIKSKKFVPLGKFSDTTPERESGPYSHYRVDLHPRISRDGRKVSIDASMEGFGRQIYLLDIGYIVDNPPVE